MRKLTNICIALASDFDAIYRYFCLIKLFKYLKLIESDYFKNRLSSLQITHGIETRNNVNENLNIPQTRSSKLFRFLYFNFIKFWDEVPSNLKKLARSSYLQEEFAENSRFFNK